MVYSLGVHHIFYHSSTGYRQLPFNWEWIKTYTKKSHDREIFYIGTINAI